MNDACGTPNPLQQQCKPSNIYNLQQNSSLLSQQNNNSANGEFIYPNIANNLTNLKLMNMTRPEMVQQTLKNHEREPVPEREKHKSKEIGRVETLDGKSDAAVGESGKRSWDSDAPNVIRYQRFYPNFASSVQDFRGLQLAGYHQNEYQPRTTEKGILEPNTYVESRSFDKCSTDYDSRNGGGRKSESSSRHFPERSTGKLGAYTIPRKTNQYRKLMIVPNDDDAASNGTKNSNDVRSPFKIAQSEHFTLLNAQKSNYGPGTFQSLVNHPYGPPFHLLPRGYYIPDTQTTTFRKELSMVRPIGGVGDQLSNVETSKFEKSFFGQNQFYPVMSSYKTLMLPFETWTMDTRTSYVREQNRNYFVKQRKETGYYNGGNVERLRRDEFVEDVSQRIERNGCFSKKESTGERAVDINERQSDEKICETMTSSPSAAEVTDDVNAEGNDDVTNVDNKQSV